MKLYLASVATGLLVGLVYSLLDVRSPAPPVIAIVGLLGILAGEQILPLARCLWTKGSLSVSWGREIRPHVFGEMPKGDSGARQD